VVGGEKRWPTVISELLRKELPQKRGKIYAEAALQKARRMKAEASGITLLPVATYEAFKWRSETLCHLSLKGH